MYPTRRKSSPRPEASPISWRRSRWSPRQRLPDPQLERALVLQALEDAQGAEPAVLVVHGDDAARERERDRLAAGVDHLVLGGPNVGVAEVPGALLAQDARRLAALVALDDTARDLQLALHARERGRVEPERVVVLGHERHGHVARDCVERLLRRLGGRSPVAAPPAEPAQPASARDVGDSACHARQRLVQRGRALEPHLALRERPGGEVDVRVREPREDAAAAEVDPVGARKRRLVGADSAGDPLPGDREGRRLRERRIERADDAVLEDHEARIVAGAVSSSRTPPATAGRSPGASARAAGSPPAAGDSRPGGERFAYPSNLSGLCWTIAAASVSPVATMWS